MKAGVPDSCFFSNARYRIPIRLLQYHTVVGVGSGEQVIEDARFLVTKVIFLATRFPQVNYQDTADKSPKWTRKRFVNLMR